MTPPSLRLRILTAIGASGLAILSTEACGATPPTPAPAADASTDTATAADGAVEEPTPEAAVADTSSDVAPDRMSVRRPLLVGTSLRSASAVPREDWLAADADPTNAPGDVDAATLAALARAYAIDGCEEHASIAAFARLTLHLLAVGAPPELVEKAHLASLDEIRHARACFALARRYDGRALGPGPLAMGNLFPASGATLGLAEMAALCAEEGCVGETLGVLLAYDTLSRTTDPLVRRLFEGMAVEETAHVELAWRVVAWCVAHGGDPVRAAVRDAIQRGIAATRASDVRAYGGVDTKAWNAHGRPTCAQAKAVAERGIVEVIEPCVRAMLEGEPRSAEAYGQTSGNRVDALSVRHMGA
jgi:hypothetical protein